MRKTMLWVGGVLVVAALLTHFTTFKDVSTDRMPVSSIVDGNINSMKVRYNGDIVKTPHKSEFVLIKDKLVGHPNGYFNLVKKVNLFGFARYEAYYINGSDMEG